MLSILWSLYVPSSSVPLTGRFSGVNGRYGGVSSDFVVVAMVPNLSYVALFSDKPTTSMSSGLPRMNARMMTVMLFLLL